ncbi:MAG TPA: redoxin domain-containing protein [Puia sp.]|nr:redoxin domain-containing protein [Puia sp.]
MKQFMPCLVGLLFLTFCFPAKAFSTNNIESLPIGSKAPDFNLPGIDGKNYSLETFRDAKILVIAFICNHCPTSQAYEDRLIKIASDYAARGVKLVAINPNNPGSLRYDELGWSDVGDSFDDMKVRAKDKHFNFSYLYDGETQAISRQYGPQSTPHIFIFDQDRILRYRGRIDDTENPHKIPGSQDARDAIEALLNHKEVPLPITKVFGCSIKWLEKKDWMEKASVRWANEPVTLDVIDVSGVKDLMKNKSDKLVLFNIWSTSCDPCTEKFSDNITLSRIYKERDFEFISICLDKAELNSKALEFLKKQQSSGRNYLVAEENKNKLIDAIDPAWKGTLPYTLLVEPGGKIVYAKQGRVDAEELRKRIFDDPLIGRLYK